VKLAVSNLSIAYEGAAQTVRPIDGFDMAVESGELVLLNGPSGSGKTTLLSAIAGLLTPEAGSITFDGEDVAGLRGTAMLRHRRDRIGMVFQSFNLIPSLTAVENVAVPLTVAGMSTRVAHARAKSLLTDLGLAERFDHRPGALSGGQQQRVAIARALVLGADLLLADEPTGNLDPTTARPILDLFAELARRGRTIILVTHDPAVAGRASRQLQMAAGTIVQDTAAGRLGVHV
jgi:putative ABC transport system ATP-binding protein